jgi:hypothetical protein
MQDAGSKMSKEVVGIQIDAKVGFFAQLNWLMEVLLYCKMKDKLPYVELTGQYGAGGDWLTQYFEWKNPVKRPEYVKKAPNKAEMHLGVDLHPKLTFPLVTELFHEHLRVRKDVLDEVSAVCRYYSVGHHTLGLHFRGSDKMRSESPYDVMMEDLWFVAREYTPHYGGIFVASDEPDFEDFISTYRRVSFIENEIKCNGEVPVHDVPGDKYKKGLEALCNCLVLSRCGTLIKTISFLSGWSKVFNPALDVIIVGEQHERARWWPDRDIKQIPLEKAHVH